MKVGIMTGGGDAPGLNGVIEAATRNLLKAGIEVIGVEDGFEGIYEKNVMKLGMEEVEEIHQSSGTILGTSNKRGIEQGDEFVERFRELGLAGMIAAGGDGTFKALSNVAEKINIIGIPKTIDNDLAGTEVTFGHYTACGLISRSISTLKRGADAHRRIMVIETMGRTAGWLALNGGLAGYADAILIPERDFQVNELARFCKNKLAKGKRGLVICVSEGVKVDGQPVVKQIVQGAPEAVRLGGVSQLLARSLEDLVGLEARNVILGHLQRSEPPEVFDRLFTLELGCAAAELAKAGRWNLGLAYSQCQTKPVDLKRFCGEPRLVPLQSKPVERAKSLDIFI